jgi:hypothetical protein
MTRDDYVGVKLVAVAPLSWTTQGVLNAPRPGDIFELEAEDLAVPGVDPAFWLATGNVVLYQEPTRAAESEQGESRPRGGSRGAPRVSARPGAAVGPTGGEVTDD